MMAHPTHHRLTPPSHHKQQHKQHQQFLEEQYTYSPRTITLQNQSDSILRGMTARAATSAADHPRTAMMIAAQREQLFRQTVLRNPYLPSTGQLSASSTRPIQITRRKQNPPGYAAPQANDDDAHLSASPSELQHFYDEATWRMYHLIQTARSEKQANKATTSAAAEDEDLMDSETHFDRFFKAVPNRTPASLVPSSTATHAVVPEDDLMLNVMDKDEGVFELDDL